MYCKHIGPHLRNERTTEIWAYGRFYAKLGIYQYGRERWLRSNLTSGLSSCTQVFESPELACSIENFRECINDSILFHLDYFPKTDKQSFFFFFPFRALALCANSSINNRPWGINTSSYHAPAALLWMEKNRNYKRNKINRATRNIFLLINRLTKEKKQCDK